MSFQSRTDRADRADRAGRADDRTSGGGGDGGGLAHDAVVFLGSAAAHGVGESVYAQIRR